MTMSTSVSVSGGAFIRGGRRIVVLDRRVADAGSKEEYRHPEREEAKPLEVLEGTRFPGVFLRRDDLGHRKEPQTGLQVLAPAPAAVLLRPHRGC
jgi:hypothetical protein